MLRKNIIYTFLLGFLFLSFGFSLNEAENVEIETHDKVHRFDKDAREDKMVLHSLSSIGTVGNDDVDKEKAVNQSLPAQVWNQEEMLLMLMELKKIQDTHSHSPKVK